MRKKLCLMLVGIFVISFINVVGSEENFSLNAFFLKDLNLMQDVKEENLNSNQVENNPQDEIIERNGTKYIIRDGEEMLLSEASSTYYLSFTDIPSSICNNEEYDVKVKGNLKLSLSQQEASKCLADILFYPYKHWVSFNLYLMENDVVGDDQIAVKYTGEYTYDCVSVYFSEKVFTSADLGYYVVSDLGDYGEVYAKATYNVVSTSTSTVDILGYDTCDCLSGACCNLASRPYKYKPSGSQPTGYTDSYYCDAVNSPTGTNHVVKKDWYCDGQSSSAKYSDSNIDTCGTCEYCTSGDSTCNFYSSSTACGAQDCDYRDTACRDYHDKNKYCDGAGGCIAPSCNDYTNNPKHTSCGSGKECDGSGNCITCTSHSYTACSDNDVYYYDACDNRQEKSKECGDDSCGGWFADTCHGDDVYETQTCYDRGCKTGGFISPQCYVDTYENERYVKTCEWGCTNGYCNPNPNIVCYSDSDCPRTYSNPYCYDDDVKKDYTDYKCENPGTEQSYCKDIYQSSIYYDCGEDSYSNNYCYDNDVYRDFMDRGCSGGSCFETTNRQKVQECGIDGCSNEQCNPPACTNDCSSGQTRCSGNIKQTCGNYDADSCLEWPLSVNGTGNENCGKTKYCSSNSCLSCSAGTANCNENPADGCEINLLNDNNNCGSCGNVCSAGKSCQNGNCTQKLQGDVNGDCKVDIFDLVAVGLCYGKDATGSCVTADLSGNGKVDIFDLATVGINYGKVC